MCLSLFCFFLCGAFYVNCVPVKKKKRKKENVQSLAKQNRFRHDDDYVLVTVRLRRCQKHTHPFIILCAFLWACHWFKIHYYREKPSSFAICSRYSTLCSSIRCSVSSDLTTAKSISFNIICECQGKYLSPYGIRKCTGQGRKQKNVLYQYISIE